MLQSNLKPLSSVLQPGGFNDPDAQKSISQRHSNIEKLRKSQRPSQIGVGQFNLDAEKAEVPGTISDNTATSKQYKTLQQFLDDMFTNSFVRFTHNVKRANGGLMAGEEILVKDQFRTNEAFLRSGKPLVFPADQAEKLPLQLREIYETLTNSINKDSLLAFHDGKLFSERLINVYFKILEKMNLVQLAMDNYQRQ